MKRAASSPYPVRPEERTRWILAHRPARVPLDPQRPVAFFREEERGEDGRVGPVAVIFLTNRECPWRCLMCDLWKHTLKVALRPGAILAQIDHALAQLRRQPGARSGLATTLKLYNAGSFYDTQAIPPADYPAIAQRASGFKRLVVECHPALVGDPVLQFRDLVSEESSRRRGEGQPTQLEVALGLETIHPTVLPRLNKRMTPGMFARAVDFLRRHGIGVRAFVLVKPPFLDEAAAIEWARRSTTFAFGCGANVVCLIPTRGGNGALEALAGRGQFAPPTLATLEAALASSLEAAHERGRVFADLWDLERLACCPACLPARQARLREMNLTQRVVPAIVCGRCGT